MRAQWQIFAKRPKPARNSRTGIGTCLLMAILALPVAADTPQRQSRADGPHGAQQASAAASCAGFDQRALEVNTEHELERLVEQAITLEAEQGGISWNCLVASFDGLAANTRTIVSPHGGPAGSDVYGFAIDRRAGLKPPYLLPMGSSGRFVALVRATQAGNVAIVGPRGVPRWLDLGAPGRIAPIIDPLGRRN